MAFLKDIGFSGALRTRELVATDTNAIKGHIASVLTTLRGERQFEPDFGSDIPRLLQEPADDITLQSIRTSVLRDVTRWVTYLTVDMQNTNVYYNYDRGIFIVNIRYNIIGTNITDTVTLEMKA